MQPLFVKIARKGRILKFPPFSHSPPPGEEQQHLILEYKVSIFEEGVHEDNEFAHDGGEGNNAGCSATSNA